MNKKLSSLICIALIIIVSIPVVSIVFARKSGRGPLEKIVFIHYKKGHAKPPGTPGKGPDKDGGDDYYKLLGAKWQDEDLPVTYYIDPIDPTDSLLDPGFVVTAIIASDEEWDSWTGADLFADFAETHVIYDGSWDNDAPDGRNEFVFGDYPQDGVIAVCVVWGYFRGASGKGEIVEFDIMFDIDFTWGDAGSDPMVMDLQNIATHELGHGVGLDDLYEDAAKEQTMYGHSVYGETKKRTLEDGDIAGIQVLYGK